MDLDGRHALVTGGATGIGHAIAEALAGAGATVTITGRRAAVLEEAAEGNPRLHPAPMDVTDEASVRGAVATAAAERGPVAICVANAGIAEGGRFLHTTLEEWRRVLAVNLDGAFLTFREALATLPEGAWGRMIAVSSIAGVHGLKGAPAYTASKHGMIGLVRSLSEEFIGGPVTFNALCPGYVETEIVAQQIPALMERKGLTEEEAVAFVARGNRHRRLLEPAEVAAAALWLCGPGSQSVNGQAIQIAGGQVA